MSGKANDLHQRAKRAAGNLNAIAHRDHVGWHVQDLGDGNPLRVDMTYGGPSMSIDDAETVVTEEFRVKPLNPYCLAAFQVPSVVIDPVDSIPAHDPVNRPAHYYFSPISPFEAIKAWGLNYHLGTVVAYIARHAHKGTPLDDLRKALRHLEQEIRDREEAKG